VGKWEMVPFDIAISDETKNGTKIMKENYLQNGRYPIIDQGKELIAGYSNKKDGIYENIPAIIFGDHTRVIKYIDMPFFLGADGVKLLKSKISEIDYKYLYYYLTTERIPNTGYNRHFKWLKEVCIPLPPLEVQRQIADVLDRASALIEKRKAQIEKLDLLVKSQFIEMFGDPVTNPKGWEIEKLEKMGELNRGVSKHRPRNDPKLLGGKYPLIQTGDVANAGLYLTSYTSTYSELGLKQSKIWSSGTLCITIAANIAKTSILSFDACFPDSVVGFSPNGKTNTFFIYYWFGFLQKLLEEQAPESAQKNINLKILNDLDVICPPLPIQNEFTAFVERVEVQKALLKRSFEKLELNYQSLIQKCFREELF